MNKITITPPIKTHTFQGDPNQFRCSLCNQPRAMHDDSFTPNPPPDENPEPDLTQFPKEH